jgi:hypothetical protein
LGTIVSDVIGWIASAVSIKSPIVQTRSAILSIIADVCETPNAQAHSPKVAIDPFAKAAAGSNVSPLAL